jgi:hypothetical protein
MQKPKPQIKMPRKITEEEAAAMGGYPLGRKHFVHAWIEQMKPGDTIVVTRREFTWKGHTPKIFANRIMKSTKKKFIVENLMDKSGWKVKRVE